MKLMNNPTAVTAARQKSFAGQWSLSLQSTWSCGGCCTSESNASPYPCLSLFSDCLLTVPNLFVVATLWQLTLIKLKQKSYDFS
jgi:hypothetical protein